jgi:hypothetical protein
MDKLCSPQSIVKLAVAVLLLLPGISQFAAAQVEVTETDAALPVAESKEHQTMLLQLKEAQFMYEQAVTDYNREEMEYKSMQKLFQDGVVSGRLEDEARRERDNRKVALEQARLELERTKIGFVSDATHITVEQAIKYRVAQEGKYRMKFVIRNSSNVDQALVINPDENPTQEQVDKERERVKKLLGIENLIISIMGTPTGGRNVEIGSPLETKVPYLATGDEFKGEFVLQQDVEQIDLIMKYLKTVDTRTIYLEKVSGEDIVRVESKQFAQEGALNTSVNFDLGFNRLAEDEKTFALEVVNIPQEIRYQFESGGNALRQVKFTADSQSRELFMRTYVPEKLDQDKLDKPINFFAIVAHDQALDALDAMKEEYDGTVTGDEVVKEIADKLTELKVGFERLQLTPVGVPEMELTARVFYHEIMPNEQVDFEMILRNSGTVSLNKIRLVSEAPYGWDVFIDPETVPSLEPDEETKILFKIVPPADITVGRYEIDIHAECEHKAEKIESDNGQDKTVTIEVASKANLALMITIVVLILVLVLGIAFVTVRVSRR